jgi:hypothetical protein
VLEWETSSTAKKSFFSKPAFCSDPEKPPKEASIGTGTDEIATSNVVSSPASGFFTRNRKKKLIFGGIGALLLLILILGLGLGLGLKKKG